MSVSHRQARKWIQARANGQLAAAQMAKLDDHLQGCETCQAYAAELQQLETALYKELPQRWPRPEAQNLAPVLEVIEQKRARHRWRNRFGQLARVAAGVVAVLVVGIVALNSGLLPQDVALAPSEVEPAAEFVAEPGIAAACQNGDGVTHRYRFDNAEERWVQEGEIGIGAWYVGRLADEELLVQVEGEMWDVTALRLGERPLTFEGSANVAGAWPMRLDPTGDKLLLDQFASRNVRAGVLADLGCSGEDCPLTELTGMPVWSPDGQQTLVEVPPAVEGEMPFLFFGTADGVPVTSVAQGGEPFWIGSNVYGFITADDDGNWSVEAIFSDSPRQYSATAAQWSALLPTAEPYRPSQTVGVVDVGYYLLLEPEGVVQRPSYLLYVDAYLEEISFVGEVEGEPFGMQISPDGRWVGVQADNRGEGTLYLFDVQGEGVLSFPADYAYLSDVYWSQAWSPDGEELLVIERGRPMVLTVETGAIRPLDSERSLQCTTAWWE